MKFTQGITTVEKFCKIFVEDKLCAEFIKLRYNGSEHIKFLSFSSDDAGGHFASLILVVGAFSDGTDLKIERFTDYECEYAIALREATLHGEKIEHKF